MSSSVELLSRTAVTKAPSGELQAYGPTRLVWDLCFTAILFASLFAAVLFTTESKSNWAIAYGENLLLLSSFLLLSLIEHITAPAGPRKPIRKWMLHLHLILGYMISSTLIFASLLPSLIFFLSDRLGIKLGLIDLSFDKTYGVMGVVAGSILGLFAGDFVFYWWHRLFHKSKILWQHHKLHHMDPQFDALTTFRNNWVEPLSFLSLTVAPTLILFKINQSSLMEAGLINGIVLYVLMMMRSINHSNLRLQFGWASIIWMSPQTHRIHHSCLPQHFDKNFAGYFPLWDILFGTYYHPARNEFPPTGVQGEKEITSFWEAQIFTLREWRKMFRAWRGKAASA